MVTPAKKEIDEAVFKAKKLYDTATEKEDRVSPTPPERDDRPLPDKSPEIVQANPSEPISPGVYVEEPAPQKEIQPLNEPPISNVRLDGRLTTQPPKQENEEVDVGTTEEREEDYLEHLGLLPPKFSDIENPERTRLRKILKK